MIQLKNAALESSAGKKSVHALRCLNVTLPETGLVVLTGASFTPDKLGAMGYDSASDTYFTCLDRRRSGAYHGTGDLFAATVVGGMMRGLPLEDAVSLAVRAACFRKS